jgi:hypothetical protein
MNQALSKLLLPLVGPLPFKEGDKAGMDAVLFSQVIVMQSSFIYLMSNITYTVSPREIQSTSSQRRTSGSC